MEYLSALVMARSLNRTLCLAPFFPGPLRHTGNNLSSERVPNLIPSHCTCSIIWGVGIHGKGNACITLFRSDTESRLNECAVLHDT